MKRVIIYFRYSSKKDAQVKNSEVRQREDLFSLCSERGWMPVAVEGDKSTKGDSQVKPALEALKQRVASRELVADTVLVDSFDRLTRKDSMEFQEDVRWIRDAGMELVLSDKNLTVDLHDNQQLFMLQMEVYAANQYLKDLASKVTGGLATKFKNKTLRFARPPFGFDKNAEGMIVPNSDMQYVLRMFEAHKAVGTRGCIEILRESPTYSERPTRPNDSTVRTILRNPIYIGKRVFGVQSTGKHQTLRGKGVKTGHGYTVNRLENALYCYDIFEPIVDPVLFHAVQRTLEQNQRDAANQRRQSNGRGKAKYSGFIRCGHCGGMLQAKKNKHSTSYYCMHSTSSIKGKCKGGRKSISEKDFHKFFGGLNKRLRKNEDFHFNTFLYLSRTYQKARLAQNNFSEEAQVELRQKKARLKEMVKSFGENCSETFMEVTKELDEEIRKDEQNIAQAQQSGLDTVWFERLIEKSRNNIGSDFERYLGRMFEAAAFAFEGKVRMESLCRTPEDFLDSIKEQLRCEITDEIREAAIARSKELLRNGFGNQRAIEIYELYEEGILAGINPDFKALTKFGIVKWEKQNDRNAVHDVSFELGSMLESTVSHAMRPSQATKTEWPTASPGAIVVSLARSSHTG